MIQNVYKFEANGIKQIHLEDYSDEEFCIAKMGFLSTRPNSHGLDIREDVLRQYASTVLGKWVTADMTNIIDASTHTSKQHIVGIVPKGQEVDFIEAEDGYLDAWVDVVISKIYARDYCAMFEKNNYQRLAQLFVLLFPVPIFNLFGSPKQRLTNFTIWRMAANLQNLLIKGIKFKWKNPNLIKSTSQKTLCLLTIGAMSIRRL